MLRKLLGKSDSIKAISLLKLIKDNHIGTNHKSLNSEVLEVKYAKTNKNLFTFLVRSKESYSNPAGHLVNVLFYGNNSTHMLAKDVKVSCTCPSYTYWGSKYNATIGNYNYRTRTKFAPDIRDPNRERKICKHIVAVRPLIKNSTSKTIKKNIEKRLKSSVEPTYTTISYEDDLVRNCLSHHFSDLADYGLEFIEGCPHNFEKLMLELVNQG